MREGRFTEEQLIRVLSGGESGTTARKHGIGETTLDRWREKHGGAEASELRRLRELEVQNRRLKKMVVDRDLELEAMKEITARELVSAQVGCRQLICP